MKQKIFFALSLVGTSLLLAGCTGPGEAFEPTTYGVRNSIWENMSTAQRQEAREDYYIEEQLHIQREILAEQKRKNDLLEQQIRQEDKLAHKYRK